MRWRNRSVLVQAASVIDCDVCQGIAAGEIMVDGDKLPDSIQLFPPGTHKITALKAGKPADMTVNVDPAAADSIRKDFVAMCKASETGQGPKPFIDFNHEDREASGWVTDVSWAGEDPKTGGIRAKISWSKPGIDAVLGKSFRQFSPNFRVSPTTGEIVGTTANMGGLVNRPAFRSITPFFAREGGNGQSDKTKNMEKLTQALVALGLLTATTTDETAAVLDLHRNHGIVKAKLADYETRDAEHQKKIRDQADVISTTANSVAAKDAEIKRLGTECTEVKAKLQTLSASHAKSVVDAWVEGGHIAAKDAASQKMWLDRLTVSPDDEALMAPFISAKAVQGNNGDVTKPIVKHLTGAGAGAGDVTDTGTSGAGKEPALIVKAKEIAKERKISLGDAQVVAAKENPEMYAAYRKGLIYVQE